MRSGRPSLETFISKDFQRFLNKLSRKGGMADTVYKQVMRAMVLWERGEDPELPLTHHGESRVPHVVKYDLKGRFRLVVYEHAGKRIPLMVGDHEEADQWLERNRGRDFTVEAGSKRVEFTIASTDKAATEAATSNLEAVPAAKGPILARLPQDALAALDLPLGTVASLNAFATFEEVEDDRIWTLIQNLPFPSEHHRQVIIQVIALVASGQVEKAAATVTLFAGAAKTASESPEEFATAVEGGENSDKLIRLGDISVDELDRINRLDGFTDWMLYLHPDQRRLVDRDYNGPARLLGVSGSGKTTVLVHRAHALAKKYPGQRILVLTLNPALVQLLRHLFDSLCSVADCKQIDVMTVYDYCYNAVKTISPRNLIEKHDPKSGEDLATCWEDFLEKPQAQSIRKITEVLEQRESTIDAAGYILDELIWIRSGFGRNERQAYLTCERPGRGIPLPRYDAAAAKEKLGETEFPPDTRARILQLLDDYEAYMKAGGLMDDDGVSLEAFSVKDMINNYPQLRARCVLVDEVQDCSTVELAVIAEVPTETENGLFLTGDPVQKVFAKQHDLSQAGIDVRGRAALLKVNYRNTRQVLQAAYSIIDKYREVAPVPPSEVLEPEYAVQEGPKPKVYECKASEEQTKLIMSYLGWMPPDEHDGVCICTASEQSLSEFRNALHAHGYSAHRISGRTDGSNSTLSRGIKLCLMRDIKGYEFKYVFLVDLIDSVVYPKGMPWDERWRVAFQIYVAMTRARRELFISFINNRSYFLGPLQDLAEEHMASDEIAA